MSDQPPINEAEASARRGIGPVNPPRKGRADGREGTGRGARAGRFAAGAAIGSAAIAGALLFAGKIDRATPKRMWDKVKPPRGAWGSPSKD